MLSFAGTTGGATIDASGTGALVFSNAAAIAAGGGAKTVTLTGTGALRIDGIVQDNTATFKTNISKSGAGTAILGGVNIYTGTTSITGGNLVYLRGQTLAGNVTQNNAGLTYAAAADAALNLSGTLAITGGANAILGGSIGSTTTSSQILVTGNATATAAALKVNVYGISSVTPATGTYTLLKSNGAAPTLNNAVLSLGTVYNNTNFTVGALSSTASDISVDVTSATPLTTAFWNGGLAGATNVWAASDGAANSNWVTAAGGGATALVPGGSTAVTISATTPTLAPTSTVLGANMTIGSLAIANTGGLGLNADGYSLTVNSGITMNTGVAASTIASGLVTGGAQTWTNSSANVLTLSGNISGTGLVTKAGTGPLTISGAGSYTGGLTLSAASTLRLNSSSALGTGTFTMGAAGTLDNTSGSAITMTTNNVLALNSNFTFTGTNDLNMGTGATTISAARTITVSGGNLTLGGTFGMAGFALTKAGAGTLTLSGVISGTTANGSTSMTVNAGTLNITGVNNSFSGNILVNGATSVLQVTGSNGSATGGMLGYVVGGTTTAAYKQITLQNGGIFRPTATFNDNNVTTALPANGYVFNMGTGGGVFDIPSGVTLSIDDGGGTGTAAGASQLQGSGSLTKTGLGTLGQDDSTGYAGAIIVAAGTLQPATANAFGATSAGTTIQSGARLNVNGVTMTNQEPLTLNGAGLASAPAGALTNASGTAATWVGPVTLGGAATIGASAAGALTLSSTATVNTAGNALTFAISGAGRIFTDGIISGAGAVIVNGSSTGDYVPRAGHTYTGGTTLNAGSFTAIDFNSTGPAGNPTAGPFGSGTTPLVLNGGQLRSGTGGIRTIGNTVTLAADTSFYTVTTEKSLVFSGPVTITGASRTLTSNVGTTVAGAVVEFSGAIGDGGNGFGLTKAGTGNLVLSGANTYGSATAGTTVSQGYLNLTGSLLSGTPLTVAGGTTFSMQSNAANPLPNISTLTLGTAAATTNLNFDLGADAATSDSLTTPNAAVTAGNILLNLNGISGYGTSSSYTLISAASGLGGATYALNSIPGGYVPTLSSSATAVTLNLAAGTAGNLYWLGGVNGNWGGISGANTNWTTDSAGTLNAGFAPGSANTVIFSATSATGPALSTTLEGNFTINDLKFASAPTGVTSVTIGSAVFGNNILTIAPTLSSTGITLAQGSGAVTISAPIALGAPQTWAVDSSTPGAGTASSLTVSGPITGGAANGLTLTTTAGTTPIIFSATGSTYSGPTTISAATIVQGGATNGFSPNSAVTVNGTLNTGAFNQAVGSLIGGSGIVQNGSATNATLTIGSDNLASATFAGTLQDGSTGTLGITKAGTGTQILSGTNTYTGTTTVSAGTLQIANPLAYSAASGLVVSGGVFDVNGNSLTVASIGGAATGTITNNSSSTAASTATAPGTPSGAGVYVDALTISGAGGTFAAQITDGATRKLQLVTNNANSGTGFMGFTNGALNTFSGGLVLANHVNGTRLNINAGLTGTPFGTGPIIVGQAATDKAGIYFSTATTLNNPVISNTTLGTDRVGTFRIDVAATLTGTLTANLAPMALSTNGTGSATITGKITGPEGFQLLGNPLGGTALTVTLSNAAGTNDYQGDTIVNFNPQTKPYTMKLGANNQIPDGAATGNLILNTNGAGIATFDLAGFNETINGLSGNAGSIVTNSSTTTASILTLGGNNQTAAYAGGIQEAAGGGLSLIKTGSGTQTLSGANTFSGSITANGGTLAMTGTSTFTGSVNANSGGTVAFNSSPLTGGALGNSTTINLNGGGISYTGNTSNALNRTVSIAAGDGTINVADSLGTLTLASGSLSSTGGNLVKSGPGTATIAGSVSLNGGLAGVTVNGGKLVAGFGTGGVSSINIGASGNLSLTNGVIEALTLGNTVGALTLAGGARLGFELDGSTNDSIAIGATGTALTAGTITLDFTGISGGVTATTYNLLTSTLGGLNAATYVLGSAPNGFNYTINKTDNLVSLTTTAYTPIYWRGGVDNSWATTVPGTNFTDVTGTTDAGHTPLATETVIFNAAGVVGPSVTTTLDGAVTIDSLQFNGVGTPAVTAVTINPGTGGSLTLTPVSTSGGIKVLVGGGNATIAAPLTVGAAQTWDVDPTGSLTISGNTTFNANVNKSGAGALTLSGNNSGTGNIALNAGTLNINSNTALGTSGTLTINPGTTIDSTVAGVSISNTNPQNWTGSFAFTGTNSLNMGNGAVNISNNPTVTIGANTLTVGGALSGTSGLTKAGAGTLVLAGNNSYSGTTNVNAGVLTLSGINTTTGQTVLGGGTLNVNNASGLGSGALIINSGALGNTSTGAIVNAGSQAIAINGNFAFNGPDNLDLGSSAVTLSVTPMITTTAGTLTIGNIGSTPLGLGKNGAGTLTLVGTNQYLGNTTIEAGTLNLTGSLLGNNTNSTFSYGTTAGNTIVNMSGTLNAWVTRGANVAGSVAVFNQTAGSVTIVPTNSQDQQYLANNGGYGMLNITGGTFNTGRFDGVGATTSNTSAAVIYVGGTGTLNQNVGDWFLPIRNNGMASITVAPGGSLIRSSAVTAQFVITGLSNLAGTTSYGMLNVAGGSVDTGTRGINFGQSSFTPAGTNTGFLNVSGGTLLLGLNTGIGAAGGTTSAFVNFAGGTVKATNTMSAVIPASTANYIFTSTIFGPINNSAATGNTSQNFNGGMVVDTNNFNVTFSNPLLGADGKYAVTQGNITIPAAGNSGYIGAPMVQFAAPAGGGTPASGYALISGGQVTGIVITNPGTYAVGETPLITLTGGGGSIAAFNASALSTLNASAGITKNSPGTLVLSSGASTFKGPVVVNEGILQWNGALTNIGAAGAFGLGDATSNATNAASLVLNGSTWSVTNANTSSTDRLFTVNQNGGTVLADNTTAANLITLGNTGPILYTGSGARTLTLGGAHPGGTANANTFAPQITDAGVDAVTLQKTGTTNWLLTNAANNYTGGTNIQSGILGFASGALGTTGNITFTGNSTLQWATGNTQDVSGRLVMTNAVASTFDTNGNNVTLASAIGNASSGALVKSGAGTLILSGANTYTGITTIAAGNLNVGSVETAGTSGPLGNQLANAASTILMTGGALQFSAVNTNDYSGRFSAAGSQAWNIDTNGQTVTFASSLAGTGSTLTKLGDGMLTLSGLSGSAANNFNGLTTIDRGTLRISNTASFTGGLTFGQTAASTTSGTLDLSTASATYDGALTVQTNSATANTISIGAGQTLTVNGNVIVGTSTAAALTRAQVTGAGTWTVNNPTGRIVVANTDTTGPGASAELDLSGLATFNATVANIYVGRPTDGAGASANGRPLTDKMILAASNTITATGVLAVGGTSNSFGAQNVDFKLGTSNTINAGSIVVGSSRTLGNFLFNTGLTNPSVTLRGATGGTSRTDITLGDQTNSKNISNGGGGSSVTPGTMDFTGGTVDARIGTLQLGVGATVASNIRGEGNGVFTFGGATSVVDINTLIIGQTTSDGSAATSEPTALVSNSSFNMNGGTFQLNTALTIGNDVDTSNTTNGVQSVTGAFNQAGGTATIGAIATPVNVVMGNHIAAGNSGVATATMNLTGGATSVFGNIQEGTVGAGTITSTLTLNGGSLDMKGNSIGVSGSLIDNLNFQSGTLQNVAQINNGGAITKTTVGTLVMTGNLAYTGATNVTDGTLTYDAASVFNPAVANGTLTVNGATAVANIAGTYNSPAGNGTAYVTLQGGGVLNFSGNSLLTNGATGAGFRIGEGSAGTMNMTAGTMTLSLLGSSNVVVGRSAGGNGLLYISGGTMTINGAGGLQIANTAGNTGTITVGGTGQLAMNSTGSLSMGPGTATINLNAGGIFTLASAATATGTSTINFDGGTLRAGLNTSSLLPATLTAANVLAGGAKIDTNGFDVTVANTLLPGVPGDGGLTKSGTGALTLSAANTYTGGTVLSAGTLVAANSTGSALGTGGLTLNGGVFASAVTGGSITGNVLAGIGSHTIAPGGIGSLGALTVGGLTLNANSILNYDITTNITLDALTASGALAASGLVNIQVPTGLAVNTYKLIGYNSTALTNASNFTLNGGVIPSGYSLNLNTGSNQLELLVASVGPLNLTWNGGAGAPSDGAGTWDVNTTSNWWTTSGVVWTDNNNAIFGAGSGAAGTVSLAGTVKPNTVTFNAPGSGSYTLTGGGIDLNGATGATPNFTANSDATINSPISNGGLNKSGAATLTLTNTHTYTGSTTVTAGTLRVDGSIAASSGVSVAGSATFVAGTTQVVKSLNLSAASSNASILAGAIRVLSVGDNTAASPLTLTGGKMDLNTSALIVDFSAGNEAANLTAMKTAILAGRGTGVWDGTSGLTSSAAAAAASVYGVGYAPSSIATGAIDGVTPDASAVVARYTRLGDANLDGSVNFFDLTALAAAYGAAGEWYNGDFDYSGTINFFDLTALAANYGTGLPSEAIPGATPDFSADLAAAFASVPEPGAISLLGLAALALLKRRNNRKAA